MKVKGPSMTPDPCFTMPRHARKRWRISRRGGAFSQCPLLSNSGQTRAQLDCPLSTNRLGDRDVPGTSGEGVLRKCGLGREPAARDPFSSRAKGFIAIRMVPVVD